LSALVSNVTITRLVSVPACPSGLLARPFAFGK
jgi:hypothetical protein